MAHPSSSRHYNHATATTQAFAQLRSMFPNVDPTYLQNCIYTYPSTFTADRLIAKVASKMLDLNHGNWPTVLLRDLSRLTHSAPSLAKPARKGKGRAFGNPLEHTTLLQVDEVATRNSSLLILNEMFPEVDLGYLRQALIESPHSYLYSSLSSLLSDATFSPDAISQWQAMDTKARSSRSTTRRKHEPLPKRPNPGEMSQADLIKDERYADGALQLLCKQFPDVWKSSIKAIMAEHNNDYFSSVEAVKRVQEERPTNFLTRTWAVLTQALSNMPNTLGTSVGKDDFSIATYLANHPSPASLSPMLLYELQLHLSVTEPPIRGPANASAGTSRTKQRCEELQYQDLECGCCFSDIAINQAATCTEGCIFCMECLSRTVQESVYGQAPLQINRTPDAGGVIFGGEGTGIRCLSIEGCQAPFSDKELRRCISKELYAALEARLAQENLQRMQLYELKERKGKRKGESEHVRIVQCPFCAYVAVEDVPTISYLWEGTSSTLELLQNCLFRVAIAGIYLCWMLSAIFVPELLNSASADKRVSNANQIRLAVPEDKQESIYLAIQPIEGFQNIQTRLQRIFDTSLTKRQGTVFRCRNTALETQQPASTTFATPAALYSMLPPAPTSTLSGHLPSASGLSARCGRPSCRLCLKLYYPGHECLDSTAGLRLLKEQAASNAVKRQCPECGLSFVKDNGCNKIVCRCGYVMCFVCRKGIAEERYAHFCQHVRDPPGSACTVCTKCDLFKEEDERLAVRKAIKRAEEDWCREHPEGDALVADASRRNSQSFAPVLLEKLEQYTQIVLEGLLTYRQR